MLFCFKDYLTLGKNVTAHKSQGYINEWEHQTTVTNWKQQ